MSVLRSLEQKIEGLVQGAFSRAFKSSVQPVELARKLAKEMEEHRSVSISRVYVPNRYAVFLSPDDRGQFEGYEESLRKELSDYLLERARSEGLSLVTRPQIEFRTDERLNVGEFGIQAQLVDVPDDESEQPSQGGVGHTMVYSAARADQSPRRVEEPSSSRKRALLVGGGRRRVLSGERLVLGRSREADLVIDDPNVSRRHAELRRADGGWAIADLDSTNGIKVNGRKVGRARLEPGDEVELGTSRLRFEVE